MNSKLHDAVREYLRLLNILEVSDEGREFYPNRLGSCRVMDAQKMEECLKIMEEETR
jgi:hypothetical protein